MTANLQRAIPAFHTPSGPPGHLPRFAEKGRPKPPVRGFVLSAYRVVFTPSGKRGDFAAGTSLLAAARTLGVDLDSVCGGRGICGRCQIEVAEGQFAKHAIDSARRSRRPPGTRSNSDTPTSAEPSRPAAGLAARQKSAATSSSTCRRRARSTGRWCASAPRSIRSKSIRSCGCITSRSASRTCASRRATSAACRRRSPSNGASSMRKRDLATLENLQKTSARRRMEGDRRRAQGPRHRRDLPRLRRARLRRRRRRRLDHHRRLSLRSCDRRGGRLGRRNEPADPLRRRPDEPRLLCDDEPGRRHGAHPRGPRSDERADRRSRGSGGSRRAARSSRRRWSAIRSCIIWRSGSIRPRSAARPSR